MPRRSRFLLDFVVLLVPGRASAATLGELRPLELPAGPGCVGPTGVPGELAVQTGEDVSFFTATRSGLTAGPAAALPSRCANPAAPWALLRR